MYVIEIFVRDELGGKWETHMTFDYQEDAFDEFEDISATENKVRLTFDAA